MLLRADMLSRAAVGTLLLAGAACSGVGGLEDPLRVEVSDGVLAVISCSEGDVLRSASVERGGDPIWSAVDLGDGLGLDVPISLDEVATSSAYRVFGELRPLSEGDRVILESDRDSRSFLVEADPEKFNDELSC